MDNDPVTVSLRTPNDANPTVWVNHPVMVDAAPSTGPSGLGGMSCGVSGASALSYPTGGLPLDGDGVKTASCTAWNNAVDPQGNHNSGTNSVTVHIDEAPPALSLEPVKPGDATALVADTSDGESGVAGASIEMAPVGTSSWTALPSTVSGTQLVGHYDDAGLRGPYTFRAQSCDNVGNCGSVTRTLTLPARAGAISEVSLQQISVTQCSSAPVKRTAGEPPAAGKTADDPRRRQAVAAALRFAPGGAILGLRASVLAGPIPAGRTLSARLPTRATLRGLRSPGASGCAQATRHRQGRPRPSCSKAAARLAPQMSPSAGR